jgi:hypothetical protein
MTRGKFSDHFTIAAGYLLALVVLLVFPMSATYPALVDFPNHLARYYLTASISQDLALQQYYATNWSLRPYLGADVLGFALMRVFDPYMAGRVLIFLCLALWLAVAVILNRVLCGRFSLWPLVTILILFNANLTWGFMNYLLTSALAVLGFTIWIVLPKRRPVVSLMIAVPIATGIYFAHIIAVGVYGLLLFLYEIGRWYRTRPRAPIWSYAWSGLQFLPVMALFGLHDSPPWASFFVYGTFADKVSAFYSPTLQYDLTADRLIFAYLIVLIWFGLRYGGRLVLHPDMRAPLLGGLLVTLAMPRIMLGVAGLDIRLPFVLVILLIAACRFEWPQRWERLALTASFLAVLVVRLALTGAAWQKHDMETRELVEAFQVMDRGSRLLSFGEREANNIQDILHWHTASYAVIERQVFLPTLFSGFTVIRVTEKYRHLDRELAEPIPESVFKRSEVMGHWASVEPPFPQLRDWPRNYDYLLHFYPAGGGPLFPEILEKVVNGSFFVLYKIADPEGDT